MGKGRGHDKLKHRVVDISDEVGEVLRRRDKLFSPTAEAKVEDTGEAELLPPPQPDLLEAPQVAPSVAKLPYRSGFLLKREVEVSSQLRARHSDMEKRLKKLLPEVVVIPLDELAVYYGDPHLLVRYLYRRKKDGMSVEEAANRLIGLLASAEQDSGKKLSLATSKLAYERGVPTQLRALGISSSCSLLDGDIQRLETTATGRDSRVFTQHTLLLAEADHRLSGPTDRCAVESVLRPITRCPPVRLGALTLNEMALPEVAKSFKPQ